MALNARISDAAPGGRIYYRGPRIVVTSNYIENAGGRHQLHDLTRIGRVSLDAHPARTVALMFGAIELVLAVPLAVAYGSAALFCAGLVAGFGLAAALLADERRNPRWMALHAVSRGRWIVLFASRDRREFEQVRRAVIRAVEANHRPRP
jgi:hypothetical protein